MLSRHLGTVVEICCMLNVVSDVVSQHSSSAVLYVKCLCVLSRYLEPSSKVLLYVKCLCVLLACISCPVVVNLLYVECLCVFSCYLSPVVEICYMLNVCVLSCISQPSSRDLLYVECLCVLSCYLVAQ